MKNGCTALWNKWSFFLINNNNKMNIVNIPGVLLFELAAVVCPFPVPLYDRFGTVLWFSL